MMALHADTFSVHYVTSVGGRISFQRRSTPNMNVHLEHPDNNIPSGLGRYETDATDGYLDNSSSGLSTVLRCS